MLPLAGYFTTAKEKELQQVTNLKKTTLSIGDLDCNALGSPINKQETKSRLCDSLFKKQVINKHLTKEDIQRANKLVKGAPCY